MDIRGKIPRLPYVFAKKHGVVITGFDEAGVAEVAHLPATPMSIFLEIRRFTEAELCIREVSPVLFQKYLADAYDSQSSILDATQGMEEDWDLMQLAEQVPTGEDLSDNRDEAPIIRLLNALFTEAIKQKASDIHIETYEHRVVVRNRIDGVLQEILEIQRGIAPLVIRSEEHTSELQSQS